MKSKRFLLLVLTLCASLLWIAPPCWAISEKQEVEIGRQSAASAVQKYGLVKDAKLLNRVKTISTRLVANVQRKTINYQMGILNCKDVNALAFPGGYFFYTKGIVELMNDEQLAFVGGHEISHIEHRDSVQALERSQYQALGVSLLQTFVKGANTTLSKSLISMANTVVSNRYSQSQEYNADRGGIFLMAAAGYDPYKSIDALEALQKLGGKDMPGFLNSLLSTHPITKDRIERAKKIAPEALAQYPNAGSEQQVEDEDTAADQTEVTTTEAVESQDKAAVTESQPTSSATSSSATSSSATSSKGRRWIFGKKSTQTSQEGSANSNSSTSADHK